MDVATVDREFNDLQQESQLLGSAIQAFAGKLQAASDGGDANAKEWVLDLKSIALQIQQEELQVQELLQALHDFTVNNLQGAPQSAPPAAAPTVDAGQAGYAAPQASLATTPQAQPQGGMLHHFLGSGFGQSIAQGAGMGVGFGMTESLISSIFQ
jgi:hypothetical protein